MASPLADSTSPLRVLIDQDSPYPHPHFKHDTKRRKDARHVAIARLSLSSFLDAYKAQVRMSKFDQNVRGNRLCVMSQLMKNLDYCNDTSTDALSSLRPMSNFQPHKKKILATASPPKVTPPLQQQPKVPPTPVNAYAYPKVVRVVNREVCHLYSLKHLIEEDFVDVYYPVDLYTRLGHQHYTKLAWIQDTRHQIYYSMNEAKRDRHHPVWSAVHERSKRKLLCWSIPQY